MNNCGDCRECCVLLNIHELNKAAREPCQHLCETGCTIYETRPKTCSDFECSWLISDWAGSLRPDLSGIMVAGFSDYLGLFEIREGCLTSDEAKTIIKIALGTFKHIRYWGFDGTEGTIRAT